MEGEPSRRSVLTSIGAIAAAGALASTGALAKEDPGGLAYRTAGELLKALADRKLSARELLEATIARIEALDPKTTRSSCAISIGRGPPPTPPTWRLARVSGSRCWVCR